MRFFVNFARKCAEIDDFIVIWSVVLIFEHSLVSFGVFYIKLTVLYGFADVLYHFLSKIRHFLT